MRSCLSKSIIRHGLWRRRTSVSTVAVVLLAAAVAADIIGACFSKIAGQSQRLPEPGQQQPGPAAAAPAAEAWLRAARRTAEARPDSAEHWQAAWESTEAWWLRPVAYLVTAFVCFGAILQRPRRMILSLGARQFNPPDVAGDASIGTEEGKLEKEAKAAKARRALQRIELPFYATGASWSDYPHTGIVVSGNLRQGALDNWDESKAKLQACLEESLGQSVVIHLLQRDNIKELARIQQFELLVTDEKIITPAGDALMFAAASLVAAVACTEALGSSTAFQSLGSVVPLGGVAPLTPLLCLVMMSEVARSAVAHLNGAVLGPRIFLPSPQFGLLGAFAAPETACSARSTAIAVALAGPLALAVASAGLFIFGDTIAADPNSIFSLNHSALSAACWPMAFLPSHCSSITFAGAQGLLMASLALLPQSPDGKVAWGCLLGRDAAKQLAEAASYTYPILALISMAFFGPGYMALPFTWALLLVNATPSTPPPPLEEASEPSPTTSALTALVLLASAVAVLPLPLNQLLASS
eukprot:TRINITY_DN59978_c0_g1_i1.p1 TRINITY_DN59978_c0_g1~~TRINITY_DN59978_c0_g1_i1.p1  ORF type:complete len:528 (+),score=81.41 TRINITY_DN59978_c0_g1_i1:85-1668(+)